LTFRFLGPLPASYRFKQRSPQAGKLARLSHRTTYPSFLLIPNSILQQRRAKDRYLLKGPPLLLAERQSLQLRRRRLPRIKNSRPQPVYPSNLITGSPRAKASTALPIHYCRLPRHCLQLLFTVHSSPQIDQLHLVINILGCSVLTCQSPEASVSASAPAAAPPLNGYAPAPGSKGSLES
jgi:hypothetical protein